MFLPILPAPGPGPSSLPAGPRPQLPVPGMAGQPPHGRSRPGAPKKSPPLVGRANDGWGFVFDYRLSWMTSASMVSTVVMILLLAWKPRWVKIMSTISAAMSTFEVSRE